MILSGTLDVAARMREEQLAGTLEALVAQPLDATEMCLGLVGFPFAFALARALSYLTAASFAMGLDLLNASWIGVVAVLASASAAFAAIAIVAAAIVLVAKRGETIAVMLVTLMNVFGGTVFPISTLPGWLQPLARALPTQVAFDGVRNALFRGAGWALDLLALVAFAAVGIPLATILFGRALGHAARSGTLAEY